MIDNFWWFGGLLTWVVHSLVKHVGPIKYKRVSKKVLDP